jgi:hypothetical protein
MSNPSELNPDPPVAEIRSRPRSPKRRRLRGWLIFLLLLSGICAMGWWLSRPSLTSLGVREIKGYDYACFLVRNETVHEASVQISLLKGSRERLVGHTLIEQTDRGIFGWTEFGVSTFEAKVLSDGEPIRVRVQITPYHSGFDGKLRKWLSAFVPARFLYPRVVLISEPFVP